MNHLLRWGQNMGSELCRPQVLLGLALFAGGAFVLWHAWKDSQTPWPLGAFMPF